MLSPGVGTRRKRHAENSSSMMVEMNRSTDTGKYRASGVMMTPALAVDGEVKVVGKVASVEEIKELIK